MNIFDACRKGNVKQIKDFIGSGINMNDSNDFGFNALHCAAMGSNDQDQSLNIEILKLLIESGCDIEAKGGNPPSRTPLFMLSEFSPFLDAVKYLVEAGANPNVSDMHGNNIVENAMMPEIKEYLSGLTGNKVPKEPEPGPPSIKMKRRAWKKAKKDIAIVLDEIQDQNIIVLTDAGYTQPDGFFDCAELLNNHPNKDSIIGFCFYTEQDSERAKDSSILPICFWGAPNGEDESTIEVGKIIVDEFKNASFEVLWHNSASDRPNVLLHKYST